MLTPRLDLLVIGIQYGTLKQVVIIAYFSFFMLNVATPLLPDLNAYATPVPLFGPVDHSYNLTIADQSYPIKWGTLGNGTLESMQANYNTKSIRIVVNDNKTDGGGLFFIELPRNVIDANSTTSIGCTEFGNSDPSKDWQTHDIEYNITVTRISGQTGPIPPGYLTSQGYDTGGGLCDHYTRTLAIFYPRGESAIQIQGTVIIPEFPIANVVGIMLALTIACVVVVTRKSHCSLRDLHFIGRF